MLVRSCWGVGVWGLGGNFKGSLRIPSRDLSGKQALALRFQGFRLYAARFKGAVGGVGV